MNDTGGAQRTVDIAQLVFTSGLDVQLHRGVLTVTALAFSQRTEIDLGVFAKDFDHRAFVHSTTVADYFDWVIRAGEFDFVGFDVRLSHGGNGLVSRGHNAPAVRQGRAGHVVS